MYRTLNNLTEDIGYNNPYKCFQSSINAIAGPVPEPMYTKSNNQRRRVINDNLARIRRVIYTHYLHDDEDSDSESEFDTDDETDTDDEDWSNKIAGTLSWKKNISIYKNINEKYTKTCLQLKKMAKKKSYIHYTLVYHI